MINIRKMDLKDIYAALDLEKSHGIHILNENTLALDLANPNYHYFVATLEDKVVGYIGISVVIDEADLISIVVSKEHTNKHIASLMMDYVLEYCKKVNVQLITLEVRSSNIPAQKLYEKYNFKQISIRKKYYDNIEDAIIMQKELPN